MGFMKTDLCENALEKTYASLLENPNAFNAPSVAPKAWSSVLPDLRIFCKALASFLTKPFLACAVFS